MVCVYLCRSSSRFFDVCVSLLLLLKGGCVSTLSGSTPIFCCSERRHAAMTTAGVSSHWSGYSPPRPRRCGCSSSKVDNRFLDLTKRESKKTLKRFYNTFILLFYCFRRNCDSCILNRKVFKPFQTEHTHWHQSCMGAPHTNTHYPTHTSSHCSTTCHCLPVCVCVGRTGRETEFDC